MARRILFAGGEVESIIPIGENPTVSTDTGYFDPTRSRCAIGAGGSQVRAWKIPLIDDLGGAPIIPDGSSVWVHSHHYNSDDRDANMMVQMNDSAGRPGVRLLANGTIQKNTSATVTPSWSNIGTSTILSGLNNLDFCVTVGDDCVISVFSGNTQQISLSTGERLLNDVGEVLMGASNGYWSGHAYQSQILVTEDIATVNAIIPTLAPSSAGAISEWSGVYTDVNQTGYSDTSHISTNIADTITLFGYTDTAVPTGYAIESLFLWSRGMSNLLTPDAVKSVARLASINFESPNVTGVSAGFSPIGSKWDKSPATSDKWSLAEINSIELGLKSVDL